MVALRTLTQSSDKSNACSIDSLLPVDDSDCTAPMPGGRETQVDCETHDTISVPWTAKCGDCGKRRKIATYISSMNNGNRYVCVSCHKAVHAWKDYINEMLDKRTGIFTNVQW